MSRSFYLFLRKLIVYSIGGGLPLQSTTRQKKIEKKKKRKKEKRRAARAGEVPSRSWRMVSCCTAKAIVAAHCRGTANPDSPAVAFAVTMADDRPAMPRDQGFLP